MSGFEHVNPIELGLLSALLGIALANDKDPDEQNVLGNFIVGIGCTILIIAAQSQYLSSLQEKAKKDENKTEAMKKQMMELQAQLKALMSSSVAAP